MEKRKSIPINNAFYDELTTRWHESKDHPVALLRAENTLRNPWIGQIIKQKYPAKCKVLDIGCGGGFLTNFLAKQGHEVTGIDLSSSSLEIAQSQDETKTVEYKQASAYTLPYEKETFDVVVAMDLLEHVEKPTEVIAQASKVLKKGGLFFFHTFNRTLLSYFIVIKGVEWCFSNAPPHMHVYPLFIKPQELKGMCESQSLTLKKFLGISPDFSHLAFWKLIFQRKVEEEFRFRFSRSLKTGYCGFAEKA